MRILLIPNALRRLKTEKKLPACVAGEQRTLIEKKTQSKSCTTILLEIKVTTMTLQMAGQAQEQAAERDANGKKGERNEQVHFKRMR